MIDVLKFTIYFLWLYWRSTQVTSTPPCHGFFQVRCKACGEARIAWLEAENNRRRTARSCSVPLRSARHSSSSFDRNFVAGARSPVVGKTRSSAPQGNPWPNANDLYTHDLLYAGGRILPRDRETSTRIKRSDEVKCCSEVSFLRVNVRVINLFFLFRTGLRPPKWYPLHNTCVDVCVRVTCMLRICAWVIF